MRSRSSSFCEQKDGAAPRGPKKLCYTGAWVVSQALPHPRTRFKKIFACFFQKALLAIVL
jgi:hypothetical protein